jgi:hypothetical protein
MPLTNFEFGEEEIDGTIIIKAYDSKQLVVAFIPREDIDDCIAAPYTPQKRRAWVEQKLNAIGAVISAKYDRGETNPYNRFGSTMRRIDITATDLGNLRTDN